MVFTDNGDLSQMILCGENQEITEVPGEMLADSLLHFIAVYYVLWSSISKRVQGPVVLFPGHPHGKT